MARFLARSPFLLRNRRLSALSNPYTRRLIFTFTIVYFFLLPVILVLQFGHVFATSSLTFPPNLWQSKRTLVIVAHPDDEALFFNPTILALTQRRDISAKVGLVVLSAGNNYGLGATRKDELQKACKALNIWDHHCSVLDVPALQDNPKEWWPQAPIQNIVRKHVADWQIDNIVTFDSGGVSGHINHRAVSSAVRDYSLQTPLAPPTYFLRTTSLIRKYTLLGDLPFTILKHLLLSLFGGVENHAIFVNSWPLYRQGVKTFASHGSQFQWDRYLYVIFSRYMWFNDLYLVNGK